MALSPSLSAAENKAMLYHGLGPGTSVDYTARVLAEGLEAREGLSLAIIPKPGASSMIASDFVSKQPPDGKTLLLAITSGFSIAPVMFKSVPYTPSDFTPITLIGNSEYLLVVRSSIQVKSVQGLIAYAKAHPGVLNYSGSAIGLMLGAELNAFAGIQATAIPAGKGVETQVVSEMLGNRIDYAVITAGLAAPQIEAGKLRALAVATKGESLFDKSLPALENVVPVFISVESWSGLLGPKNMDRKLVEKIGVEFRTTITDPGVTRKLREKLYFRTRTTTPEEMTTYMASQAEAWKKIATKIGYVPR